MGHKDEDCAQGHHDEDAKRATGKAKTKNTAKQITEWDPAEEPSQSRETVYMMFVTIQEVILCVKVMISYIPSETFHSANSKHKI